MVSSENPSLVSNLNLPSSGLQPLSLVTLSGTTKNSLLSGCWKYSMTLYHHFRQIALSCLVSQFHKLSNNGKGQKADEIARFSTSFLTWRPRTGESPQLTEPGLMPEY